MQDAYSLPWKLEDIDFTRFDAEKARADEDLIYLICASSFIESGSDLYTKNLVEHYQGDEAVQTWLRDHWEHEELQHGRALATYVRHAWPDFDWDSAFADFFAEYGAVCTSEELESRRGLELAARCVVETGTASLYRAIHTQTEEPVLKQLTEYIKSDEVRHYSHFYKYFREYEARERNGRWRVMRALYRRLMEIRNEDGDIALRHVFAYRRPEVNDDPAAFKAASERVYGLVRKHLPAEMTVKMLLKPLNLPPRLNASLQTPLTRLTERFVLH
ncbi:ferritin-like domain-containing protein [Oleiagrimonas soli]|uniref:Ferritin n=1 Tax=Oleiagrimonas soli TaxID=1543381 RepID=A0A099CTD9_9GAMM|nr:ferritin-like domain-containing protein [Oleiagrimonas soli]KGI76941.1 ferritin [Oleiagrimonas soli]MBB6185186.1 ferritin [Oleiagrimonas soli]